MTSWFYVNKLINIVERNIFGSQANKNANILPVRLQDSQSTWSCKKNQKISPTIVVWLFFSQNKCLSKEKTGVVKRCMKLNFGYTYLGPIISTSNCHGLQLDWPWTAEWAYAGIFAVAVQFQNQGHFGFLVKTYRGLFLNFFGKSHMSSYGEKWCFWQFRKKCDSLIICSNTLAITHITCV